MQAGNIDALDCNENGTLFDGWHALGICKYHELVLSVLHALSCTAERNDMVHFTAQVHRDSVKPPLALTWHCFVIETL
jgi:hypothetical protein